MDIKMSNNPEDITAFLKSWKHYHLRNSDGMEITGIHANGARYSWASFDRKHIELAISLMNEPPRKPCDVEMMDLKQALRSQSMAMVAFDTNMGITIDITQRLNIQARKYIACGLEA
jgi:hypothetical protein